MDKLLTTTPRKTIYLFLAVVLGLILAFSQHIHAESITEGAKVPTPAPSVVGLHDLEASKIHSPRPPLVNEPTSGGFIGALQGQREARNTPNPRTDQESVAPLLSVIGTTPDCDLQIYECRFKLVEIAGLREDFAFIDSVISAESDWRPYVWNSTGAPAYGLCQRMITHWPLADDDDYMTDTLAQLEWCDWYAVESYGGWQGAWKFWQQNRWW